MIEDKLINIINECIDEKSVVCFSISPTYFRIDGNFGRTAIVVHTNKYHIKFQRGVYSLNEDYKEKYDYKKIISSLLNRDYINVLYFPSSYKEEFENRLMMEIRNDNINTLLEE